MANNPCKNRGKCIEGNVVFKDSTTGGINHEYTLPSICECPPKTHSPYCDADPIEMTPGLLNPFPPFPIRNEMTMLKIIIITGDM